MYPGVHQSPLAFHLSPELILGLEHQATPPKTCENNDLREVSPLTAIAYDAENEGAGQKGSRSRFVPGYGTYSRYWRIRRAYPRASLVDLGSRCPYLRMGRLGPKNDSYSDGDRTRVCRSHRIGRQSRA